VTVNDLRDDEDHRVVFVANALRQRRQGHEFDAWDCRPCSQDDVDWARQIVESIDAEAAYEARSARPAVLLPESAVSRTLPDPAAEPTLTVPRVAAIVGISRRAAYVAVEAGEIPSIRVGRRVVIPTARFLAHFGLDEGGAR
jgi:excisionase family DNA binding protein